MLLFKLALHTHMHHLCEHLETPFDRSSLLLAASASHASLFAFDGMRIQLAASCDLLLESLEKTLAGVNYVVLEGPPKSLFLPPHAHVQTHILPSDKEKHAQDGDEPPGKDEEDDEQRKISLKPEMKAEAYFFRK